MREEADVLNWLWDWAHARLAQSRHPYYHVLAQDMRALVRSFGSKEKPRR